MAARTADQAERIPVLPKMMNAGMAITASFAAAKNVLAPRNQPAWRSATQMFSSNCDAVVATTPTTKAAIHTPCWYRKALRPICASTCTVTSAVTADVAEVRIRMVVTVADHSSGRRLPGNSATMAAEPPTAPSSEAKAMAETPSRPRQ